MHHAERRVILSQTKECQKELCTNSAPPPRRCFFFCPSEKIINSKYTLVNNRSFPVFKYSGGDAGDGRPPGLPGGRHDGKHPPPAEGPRHEHPAGHGAGRRSAAGGDPLGFRRPDGAVRRSSKKLRTGIRFSFATDLVYRFSFGSSLNPLYYLYLYILCNFFHIMCSKEVYIIYK